jgi:heme-degrading monooxygenase HmoA
MLGLLLEEAAMADDRMNVADEDEHIRIDRRRLLQILASIATTALVSGSAPRQASAAGAGTLLKSNSSPPSSEANVYVQFVKLKSGLSDAEVRRVMEERLLQFEAVPGLLQKYYAREPESGAYAGIYIWDSEASMRAFLETELRRTIPEAYRVTEPPRVEFFEVLFPLHAKGGQPAAQPAAQS